MGIHLKVTFICHFNVNKTRLIVIGVELITYLIV